jgi:hypothetical protein
MDLRSLLETIWDTIHFLSDWRFMVCFLAGIALSVIALDSIGAEPLRWIVAAAIVIFGVVIGIRWEKGS